MAVAVCAQVATSAAETAQPHMKQFLPRSTLYSNVLREMGTNILEPLPVVIQVLVVQGTEVGASRRCGRRVSHGEEPPRSLIHLSERPQNHRSLEKRLDVTSGPAHALLQSCLSSWASSKAPRGAQRPRQVPGSGWAVGGGPTPQSRRLAPGHAGLLGCTLECDLVLCSVGSDAVGLLLAP